MMPLQMGSDPQVTILEPDRQRALALQAALESAGLRVETPADPAGAFELRGGASAHCYLQSARLFEAGGRASLANCRDEDVRPSVVVLLEEPSVPIAVRAMRVGASDVVVLPASHEDVVGAVRRALDLDGERRQEAIFRMEATRRLDTLSKRERQVLHLVLDGCSNKKMAETLEVSIKTIEAHRANLMRKSGCKSVSALVKLAILAGEGRASDGLGLGGSSSEPAAPPNGI